jgi:hypothetical protein
MMNKKIIGASSLLAAGLVAGSFFSIAGANAETNSNVYPVTAETTTPVVDPTVPVTPTTPATPTTPVAPKTHEQETPVTGDLATELSNLALAANPGATVDRVENDTDGSVYEVHLTLADGSHVTVKFDADKKITATETGPAFAGPRGDGGHHGKGGHGHHDGDRGGDASGTSSYTVSPLNG